MQPHAPFFKKLKITSWLDLALILPTSYLDTNLAKSINVGEVGTFESYIISKQRDRNNRIKLRIKLTHFAQTIESIIFHPTAYHDKLFTQGSTHILQGRITNFQNSLQLNQPKVITPPLGITPRYRTALKETELKALLQTFLTLDRLTKEGLKVHEAQTLLNLHFPTNLHDILDHKTYKPHIIKLLKYTEALNHLGKLQGKRIDFPPTRLLRGDIQGFIRNLPFDLTKEQLKAIEDIKRDFQNPKKATKRVVIGDVGSGKTMVILAAAMMALPYKSILMAPTSILALQLYEEACKYLPKELMIALVMQNNSIGDYQNSHFIIGTHALLYKEDLPSIDLVMIDEQHRFGTAQRNALEKLSQKGKQRAHVLQFSATPIPRTQAMMDAALVDISLITTTPFTKSVTTKIISKEDFAPLLSHIKEEIQASHQILIIYPLVEQSEQIPYQSLDEARTFWEERFEGVYLTHGKDKEKEKALLEFRKDGNILLATTVVEVGISLPRLTLIVIVGAERLGLATLHQLRGRVGRLGLKSWCYLYTHNKNNERLKAFTKTTNGFEIAKLDLEFRNSGDILEGTIQSGKKFRWLDMAHDEEIVAQAKARLEM
ncbi:MAG TPA: ATP-dependent DNA helicase RecG [Epsilonproteobacteria bacterium]|nr:ATP-dependent DNA helicase RecG [Campylobacterota bacterium]